MYSHKQLISVLFSLLLFLASCSDTGVSTSSVPTSQSDREATLSLDNFTVENYENTSMSWALSADKAELFQESSKGLLNNIQIDFFDEEGNKTQKLRANSAETLNNQKSFLCQGGVAISSYEENIDITSNSLLFESADNRVTTDSHIKIESDSFQITGNGLLFQTVTQDIDIHANIDAKFNVSLN